MKSTLRIATRKSPLALWQANHIKDELLSHYPDLNIELLPMSTSGDKFLQTSLAKIGGKGLFVKELETALLDKSADLAVHSMKDVPVSFPPGLELATICRRADVRDALVNEQYQNINDLPEGFRIGTSSLRRQMQIMHARPDLNILPVRGNVNTRLKKCDDGQFDALILATAGLNRLNLAQDRMTPISTEQMLPAAGQGALGIECRSDDDQLKALLAVLQDDDTQSCVLAERAVNAGLSGDCHTPLAAFAHIDEQQLHLSARLGMPDGSRLLVAQSSATLREAETLGRNVAEQLRQQGAEEILAQCH